MTGYLLTIVLTPLIFVGLLVAMRFKTFTLHLCLAGRIYWRFERSKSTIKNDTIFTVYCGPVSFVAVR